MTLEEDKVRMMNATMDMHNALSVHLKDRCSFEVLLDGVPVKVDLSEAVNYSIGVEMGVAMGQIMQVTQRKQFAELGQNVSDVLQRVLANWADALAMKAEK